MNESEVVLRRPITSDNATNVPVSFKLLPPMQVGDGLIGDLFGAVDFSGLAKKAITALAPTVISGATSLAKSAAKTGVEKARQSLAARAQGTMLEGAVGNLKGLNLDSQIDTGGDKLGEVLSTKSKDLLLSLLGSGLMDSKVRPKKGSNLVRPIKHNKKAGISPSRVVKRVQKGMGLTINY